MTSNIPETDFTRDAPPKVPGISRRVQCGHYLGAGVTSYRCELGIGHDQSPVDDPEPHYSVSVHRSVVAWQEWANREWERWLHPTVALVTEDNQIVCAAGIVGCEITYPHGHGTDPDLPPVVAENSGTVDTAFDPEAHLDDGLDHSLDESYESLMRKNEALLSDDPERAEFRRGWDAAVAKVEGLCAEWDKITKGESPTTATIRALFEETPEP